jgi:hypothetical protein
LDEKKKQKEEKVRQSEMEEILRRKNFVNIPKNILPDVKELGPEPPRPPQYLLHQESNVTTCSSSDDDNDSDDTDRDADEESFAETLDTILSERRKLSERTHR